MNDTPLISVCIPAHHMDGLGGDVLAESFERLTAQSFRDFEVVVSDQCNDSSIARICDDWADRLSIRRTDYTKGPRQASANTNNAIRAARGEIVKILFQDDQLVGRDALDRIAAGFGEETVWLLCGSDVTYDGSPVGRAIAPRMHPRIRFGRNTVGSPSVLAMRRDTALEFDENLTWLMDVDMYHRLQTAHGDPKVLAETLVLNRLHRAQVSAKVTPDLRRDELSYVREKYYSDESVKDWVSFKWQVWKAGRNGDGNRFRTARRP